MLRSLDDDLWCVDSVQRLGAGVHFPARMTVIRLADGGLLLHSPVALDGATATEIEALGQVRWLVAPNCYHHLHLGPALERWPEARVIAPVGLRSKRPDLRIDADLDPGASPWAGEIELVEIEGAPALDEFVFLHRRSRTLVVCDLVFNMREVSGAMTKLVLRMAGVWQRLGQSKLWRSMTRDRAAAGGSCARVLEWEFERVIMAHGEIVEGRDARGRLREGLGWMLAGAEAGRVAA